MTTDGVYHGRLKDGKTTKSNSGSAQVELEFSVSHFERNQQWEPLPSDLSVTMYLSLADGAWKYTEKKLDSLGFNGDFANPRFNDAVYTDGIPLIARTENYQGKARQRWELRDWGGNEEAGADELARLNARYKASKTQVAKPAGRPTPPPTGQTAPAPAPASSPAPGATPDPTATKPVNRSAAWNEFCSASPEGKPDLSKWNELVAEVSKESGRTEAAFTPEDWQRVCALIVVPF